MADDHTVFKVEDMEGAFGGALKRARAHLGVTSFGMGVIDFPPNFEHYPEHDHGHDGQEEVYVALKGSAEVHVGGHSHTIDQDTFVRVAPEAKRKIVTGDSPCRVLALGGHPGRAFQVSPISELGGPDRPGAS